MSPRIDITTMDLLPRSDSPTSASGPFPTSHSSDVHVTTQLAASARHGASHVVARSYTDSATKPSPFKVKKRIIVCCDGTWQDGVIISERWKYTNILRLSRAINHVDERVTPPIPQIVLYQSGVGTESPRFQSILDGATGAGLGDKVQEAYTFIAHNYEPGDDIFLFGFSRGAYTARMIATMIMEIGVLDRTDMDHFAEIFVSLQARGKSQDKDQIELLDAKLAPWTRHDSPGKLRADYDGDTFAVKCVGVFDTVGALGIPGELAFGSKKIKTLFGFSDSVLGDHIERAYQALALNETRADFDCNKFRQSEEGRKKMQVLKQCWFAGCHSDIGGGYKEHDLSDITLLWMAANIEDILSIDNKYLFSLLQPIAPWGTQQPHDSTTGVFVLANTIQRQLPTSVDPITHESIHSSVLMQSAILPQLAETMAAHPNLVCQLMPLEQQAKEQWSPVPREHPSSSAVDVMKAEVAHKVTVVDHQSFIVRVVKSLKRRIRRGHHNTRKTRTLARHIDSTASLTMGERSWLLRLTQESSLGAFIRDLV